MTDILKLIRTYTLRLFLIILTITLVCAYVLLEVFSMSDIRLSKREMEVANIYYEKEIHLANFLPTFRSVQEIKGEYFKKEYKLYSKPNVYIFNNKFSFDQKINKIPRMHIKSHAFEGIYIFNNIYIVANSDSNSLERVIIHEYTHYIQSQICAELGVNLGDFPNWFFEGFAEYVSRNMTGDKHTDVLKIIPLAELTRKTNSKNLNNKVKLYDLSYFYIYDLIDKYGDNVVERIMIEYAHTRNFDQAFFNITKKTIEQYRILESFTL